MRIIMPVIKLFIKEINMSLKTEIKKTILEERKTKLNASLSELEDIRDDSFFVEKYFSTCSKLLEEGYSLDEIESGEITKRLHGIDWKKALSDASMNTAKEYAIRFILTNIFSLGPNAATFFSRVLADYNPLGIIKVFKGASECNSEFPKIVDALLEALVRYVAGGALNINPNSYDLNPLRDLGQGGNTAVRDVVSTTAGNMFGEIIKSSDISEKISQRFCQFIH